MKKLFLKDFLSTKRQKIKKKVIHTKEESDSSVIEFLKVKDDKIILNENEMFAKREKFVSKPIIEDADIIVTGATYSKKLKAVRWNEKKTEMFYEALNMVGTDFTLISEIFGVDRKQIRNKYIKESKVNNEKINKVLSDKREYNKEKWAELVKKGKEM